MTLIQDLHGVFHHHGQDHPARYPTKLQSWARTVTAAGAYSRSRDRGIFRARLHVCTPHLRRGSSGAIIGTPHRSYTGAGDAPPEAGAESHASLDQITRPACNRFMSRPPAEVPSSYASKLDSRGTRKGQSLQLQRSADAAGRAVGYFSALRGALKEHRIAESAPPPSVSRETCRAATYSRHWPWLPFCSVNRYGESQQVPRGGTLYLRGITVTNAHRRNQ